MTLLLLPQYAHAHTLGMSVADFDVHSDGQVEARLTFASAEPLGGIALDRDQDGVVTPQDVSAARDDLRAFLLSEIEVDADGSPCGATFRDASLTELDGLVLQASYACPNDAAEIEVTLYYLSAVARGQLRAQSTRKGIARIVAGSAMTEGVLTGERRALALRLPGRTNAAARKLQRIVLLVVGAIAAIALLAWASRRWRAARAAWQNRTP
jgi:hypothetical protein